MAAYEGRSRGEVTTVTLHGPAVVIICDNDATLRAYSQGNACQWILP
jgi:hypothetical protein